MSEIIKTRRELIHLCIDLYYLKESLYKNEDDIWDDSKKYKIEQKVSEIINKTEKWLKLWDEDRTYTQHEADLTDKDVEKIQKYSKILFTCKSCGEYDDWETGCACKID